MSLRASIPAVLDREGFARRVIPTAARLEHHRTEGVDPSRIIRSLTHLISSGVPRSRSQTPSWRSDSRELRLGLRRMPQRLQYDAIALGQLQKRVELVR